MSNLMRALLKQGLLTKRVHKIRMLNQSISEGLDTSANNFNLLVCDDEPDYDLTTDGSVVAECHPGAKIIAVQLVLSLYGMVATRLIEYIIGRDPDAAVAAGNYKIGALYTSDITTANAMIKANTWAAGHVIASDRTSQDLRINVTKALRRASKMRDGDVIRLHFTDDGAGAGNALFYLRGRIITVGP